MIFNLNDSSDKRRTAIINDGDWDTDILLNVLLLSSVQDTEKAYEISNKSNEKGVLDVKLLINDIEVDFSKGLQRVVNILNASMECY